ncbi:MAG: sigma-70 family RNA polymerase sigma factor [Chloroflexi bacterium]|nr:sigma-70 family RNA polymerase sigma factor [Chloroflexota bacterium]
MHTHSQKVGGPRSTSEATLFHQAQAGCRDSLNALMARHDGLVQAVVRRQVLGQMPFFEALQAGRGGLWRAILGYDPSRGLAFSTYAWTCIMRHVWRAVKAHARFHSVLVTSDELPPIEAQDPAVTWEATVVRQTVHHLVQRLPERLRAVIVARYGLDGRDPAIYRQIGATLGISGERARQLHTEALVWLRHPAHSQTLRSLLGRHTLADYQLADDLAQRWLQRRGGQHGR